MHAHWMDQHITDANDVNQFSVLRRSSWSLLRFTASESLLAGKEVSEKQREKPVSDQIRLLRRWRERSMSDEWSVIRL